MCLMIRIETMIKITITTMTMAIVVASNVIMMMIAVFRQDGKIIAIGAKGQFEQVE